MPRLDPLLDLLASPAAHGRYDEAVTQLEHALQCAALAVEADVSDELVAAALLHDVGHLLTASPARDGRPPALDQHHEAVGARLLRTWFGTGVAAPVSLHVEAKRYLCATEDDYGRRLSPSSRHSLALQGGPMTDAEVTAFERRRCWAEAVVLRRWDDDAKVVGAEVPPVDDYLAVLERLVR